MYESTRKQDPTTRAVGMASVVLISVGLGWVLWNGVGQQVTRVIMETTAEIIEPPPIEDEEPPPPPPVDVELPPPPPQVVLPEFTFDVPPPPNAIRQVTAVERPVNPPAPKAPPAPPPPAVTMKERPSVGRRFEKPEYPAASARAKEEGTVSVSMCVDASGRISDVKLLKSSGFPRLDDATVKGLPRTRMDPAKGTDNKPMSVCGHELDLVWELPR
jgi:protein TonB